jgi:hypothetical protein
VRSARRSSRRARRDDRGEKCASMSSSHDRSIRVAQKCERHRDGWSCSNSFHLVEKHYSVRRSAIRERNRSARMVQSIRSTISTLHLRSCWSKKGYATCDVNGVPRFTALAALQARVPFMATKSTITPHDTLLSAHLHRGVVAPIRTVCAWCAGQNRPTAVLVDVPIDDRGLSHGICPSCMSRLRSRRASRSASWR